MDKQNYYQFRVELNTREYGDVKVLKTTAEFQRLG